MKIRLTQSEVLDALCFRHYGHGRALETVLAANPNLADIGSILPAGTVLELPETSATPKKRTQLWD